MAHLLLLEVPGGNDFTVLEDAVGMGHEVTFFTGDLAHYRAQAEAVQASMALARQIVEVSPFDYPTLEQAASALHADYPFDGILCILDIRMIEASLLARNLGLRFLNPETARMARNKVKVREAMARHGLRQPAFKLIEKATELREAVREIGYPAVVKPADGYGSQNVTILRSDDELAGLSRILEQLTAQPHDYGLGVFANNRFSVEKYVRGNLIGCDVFSDAEHRVLLGINDKLMFPPPSFAIRGSCFPSDRYDLLAIRNYAFKILDAIEFDFGAVHIEMIVADDGPYLVEVNPRLVSAQIPYQMGYALERSVYTDLINLHLGYPAAMLDDVRAPWFSAIRWICADREGILEEIELPDPPSGLIRRVALFKAQGERVVPPMSNGDRIGYVIAVGASQEAAGHEADRYVEQTMVRIG